MKKRLSVMCAFALVITLSSAFTTLDSNSSVTQTTREQISRF